MPSGTTADAMASEAASIALPYQYGRLVVVPMTRDKVIPAVPLVPVLRDPV